MVSIERHSAGAGVQDGVQEEASETAHELAVMFVREVQLGAKDAVDGVC